MNVRIYLVTGTAGLAAMETPVPEPKRSVRRPASGARSLLGREAGDSVPLQGVEAEIVSIEP